MTTEVGLVTGIAASQLGVRESPIGSNRVMYNTWAVNEGYFPSSFLTAQWCAIFVSWVFAQAGLAGIDSSRVLVPVHAWCPSGLAYFQAKGRVTQGHSPKAGDIFYKKYSGSSVVGHVGIVERVNSNGTISTIEGNTNTGGSSTGIGVFRLNRKINSSLYFCHPAYGSGEATTVAEDNDMQIDDKVTWVRSDGKEHTEVLGKFFWDMGKRMFELEKKLKAMAYLYEGSLIANSKDDVLKSSTRNNLAHHTIYGKNANTKLDALIAAGNVQVNEDALAANVAAALSDDLKVAIEAAIKAGGTPEAIAAAVVNDLSDRLTD